MPLFNGGYYVRHSILQDSSLLGRLGRHADWRADRVLFSPWLAEQGNQTIMWNAILVGALVLVLAQLEYVSLQRWEEIGEIVLGLWLIASPFIFGYAEAGPLRYWHFVLGAIIALLATWELWQDWRQSDKELAQHGQ